MKSICVFASKEFGLTPGYAAAAKDLGAELAKRDIKLIYGGGKNGLMGILANEVLENKGTVTGVITHTLYENEGHDGLTELIKLDTMQARKLKMAELADGFIAMPGGLGTLEELFEVWNAAKLRIHKKPIGLLNINHFYSNLMKMIDGMVVEGFTRNSHLDIVRLSNNPSELIREMYI